VTAQVGLSDAAVSTTEPAAFAVHLDEFDGPFDLLLSLISKHKLEVTELALHQVTDEFCSYIRSQGQAWKLDEASSFLVIAATLLDLKAARLLPSGEVENTEDLALLEARDLLFARLLQYRAFKEVSTLFEQQLVAQASRLPRPGGLDPRFARLLPDVVLSLGSERFAALASAALMPRIPPEVGLAHIHSPAVSVAEQLLIVADLLQRQQKASFRALVADTTEINVIVARFLALLELYRQGRIAFDQVASLATLHVHWLHGDGFTDIDISTEFDEQDALFTNPNDQGPHDEGSDT